MKVSNGLKLHHSLYVVVASAMFNERNLEPDGTRTFEGPMTDRKRILSVTETYLEYL